MECVTTVTYSFLVNGSPQSRVWPSRGLRQGDPLSPYLFILCTEVLSGLCRRAQENGSLPGIKVARNSPAINHLLFADDTMFFCKSDRTSCETLRSILAAYERASGQTINLSKSSITFGSKTPTSRKCLVKRKLRIHNEGGSGKYLGLPEHFGRRKRDIFATIVDRMRQKSHSWSTRFLSSAGKQIMLKSVLSSMPSYAMSCFKLPVSLCKKIQSLLTRFWWDSNSDNRKISWVAWSKLTATKKAGGLGFRDIIAFNDSLLAKLTWRLIKHPHSLLSRVLLGKYCYSTPLLQIKSQAGASHGWHGILAGRNVLLQGMGWLVGSGENVNIWRDPWLSTVVPLCPYGPPTRAAQSLTVAALIQPITRSWNWSLIRHHLPQYEGYIRRLSLGSTSRNDSLVWLPEKKGVYTSKSGYSTLTSRDSVITSRGFNWLKCTWKVKTVPKIQSFLWKSMVGALPVGSQLVTRGLPVDGTCKRCGQLETVEHILLTCSFAQKVWDLAPLSMNPFPGVPSLSSFLSEAPKFKILPPTGITSAALYAWILWTLWKGRNLLVFQGNFFSEVDIITKAIQETKAWEGAQQLLHPLSVGSPNSIAAASASPRPQVYQGPLCYVDAAWHATSGNCGIGCFLCTSSFEPIFESLLSFNHLPSALAAEATAVKAAMEQARGRNINQLNIFSDCQVLINLLKPGDDYNELFGILADIRNLAIEFASITFNFIPRTENAIADALAKRALASLNSLSS